MATPSVNDLPREINLENYYFSRSAKEWFQRHKLKRTMWGLLIPYLLGMIVNITVLVIFEDRISDSQLGTPFNQFTWSIIIAIVSLLLAMACHVVSIWTVPVAVSSPFYLIIGHSFTPRGEETKKIDGIGNSTVHDTCKFLGTAFHLMGFWVILQFPWTILAHSTELNITGIEEQALTITLSFLIICYLWALTFVFNLNGQRIMAAFSTVIFAFLLSIIVFQLTNGIILTIDVTKSIGVPMLVLSVIILATVLIAVSWIIVTIILSLFSKHDIARTLVKISGRYKKYMKEGTSEEEAIFKATVIFRIQWGTVVGGGVGLLYGLYVAPSIARDEYLATAIFFVVQIAVLSVVGLLVIYLHWNDWMKCVSKRGQPRVNKEIIIKGLIIGMGVGTVVFAVLILLDLPWTILQYLLAGTTFDLVQVTIEYLPEFVIATLFMGTLCTVMTLFSTMMMTSPSFLLAAPIHESEQEWRCAVLFQDMYQQVSSIRLNHKEALQACRENEFKDKNAIARHFTELGHRSFEDYLLFRAIAQYLHMTSRLQNTKNHLTTNHESNYLFPLTNPRALVMLIKKAIPDSHLGELAFYVALSLFNSQEADLELKRKIHSFLKTLRSLDMKLTEVIMSRKRPSNEAMARVLSILERLEFYQEIEWKQLEANTFKLLEQWCEKIVTAGMVSLHVTPRELVQQTDLTFFQARITHHYLTCLVSTSNDIAFRDEWIQIARTIFPNEEKNYFPHAEGDQKALAVFRNRMQHHVNFGNEMANLLVFMDQLKVGPLRALIAIHGEKLLLEWKLPTITEIPMLGPTIKKRIDKEVKKLLSLIEQGKISRQQGITISDIFPYFHEEVKGLYELRLIPWAHEELILRNWQQLDQKLNTIITHSIGSLTK